MRLLQGGEAYPSTLEPVEMMRERCLSLPYWVPLPCRKLKGHEGVEGHERPICLLELPVTVPHITNTHCQANIHPRSYSLRALVHVESEVRPTALEEPPVGVRVDH